VILIPHVVKNWPFHHAESCQSIDEISNRDESQWSWIGSADISNKFWGYQDFKGESWPVSEKNQNSSFFTYPEFCFCYNFWSNQDRNFHFKWKCSSWRAFMSDSKSKTNLKVLQTVYCCIIFYFWGLTSELTLLLSWNIYDFFKYLCQYTSIFRVIQIVKYSILAKQFVVNPLV
jgi:hypothetical protein